MVLRNHLASSAWSSMFSVVFSPSINGTMTGSTAFSRRLIHSLLHRRQTLFVTKPGFFFEAPRLLPVSKLKRLQLGSKYLPIHFAKISSGLRGESVLLQKAQG